MAKVVETYNTFLNEFVSIFPDQKKVEDLSDKTYFAANRISTPMKEWRMVDKTLSEYPFIPSQMKTVYVTLLAVKAFGLCHFPVTMDSKEVFSNYLAHLQKAESARPWTEDEREALGQHTLNIIEKGADIINDVVEANEKEKAIDDIFTEMEKDESGSGSVIKAIKGTVWETICKDMLVNMDLKKLENMSAGKSAEESADVVSTFIQDFMKDGQGLLHKHLQGRDMMQEVSKLTPTIMGIMANTPQSGDQNDMLQLLMNNMMKQN